MSKPEWNEDTPNWANWLAQDSDGTWIFYENKPEIVILGGEGYWNVHGLFLIDSVGGAIDDSAWKNSLEQRP